MSGQEPAHLQGTKKLGAQAFQEEQLPSLLPSPALLAPQIWGSYRSAQEPQVLGVEKGGLGGAGSETAWWE